MKRINNLAVFAKNSGMVILGGGLIKHHVCNANLMVILESVKTTPHANLRWNAERDRQRQTERGRDRGRDRYTDTQAKRDRDRDGPLFLHT